MSQIANIPKSSNYDFLFKVLLIGEEENVKTGFLLAFTGSNNLISNFKPTIGVNFGISSIYLNNCTVKFQIWDISFNSHTRNLHSSYFRGASGCIVVIRSLKEAQDYLNELKTYCDKQIPVLFILITNKPINLQSNEFLTQLNIDIVTSGFEGIEWLADAILSHRKSEKSRTTILYTISNNEIQEAIKNLNQARIHNEMERLEQLRKKRATQLKIIKEILGNMDIMVEQDSIKIQSHQALFIVNILTENVDLFPLKCEKCQNKCMKSGRICITQASEGYSDDLDNNSLLILSKIYAIFNDQLPLHVLNQIKKITRCIDYRPKKL